MIIMSLEQRKVKFKPRIKLNHNICEQDLIIVTVSGGRFIEYGGSGASLFFPCSLFDVTPEICSCYYPQN